MWRKTRARGQSLNESRPHAETPPAIAFVIPVLDQAGPLASCLSAILRSVEDVCEVSLHVVDNGSSDGSPGVAREFAATVLVRPGLTIAELRNEGARLSEAPFLAFVDSDVEIGRDWARSACDALANPEIAAVCGPFGGEPAGWVEHSYRALQRFPSRARDVRWFRSGAVLIRRSAFDEVGGFDGRLQTCEDQELSLRLRAAGSRLRFEPKLDARHRGDPRTLTEVFRVERWHGRDNLRASLRSARSLREWASLLLPIGQLLLAMLAVGGVLAAPSLGAVLPAAALSLLLATSLYRTTLTRAVSPTSAPFLGTLAVSITYDAARAIALVAPGTHPRRTHSRAGASP